MSKKIGWYEPSNIILLAGAGFTKNFGGYLATEMWAAILNQWEIQDDSVLRRELLNEFNFEHFYHRVQSSPDLSKAQKNSVTEAIHKAYASMDDTIAVQSYQRTNLAVQLCALFLSRFAGEGKQRGFFFTLNQDLFVERYYHNDDYELGLRIPGVIEDPYWFRGGGPNLKIDLQNPVVLLNDAQLKQNTKDFWEKGRGPFKYIKLHGSYNWRSPSGSDAMVIGQEKEGSIEKEPLLRWYSELFQKVLSWPKKKMLVVIGYSFGDLHINRIISDAVRTNFLQLCIISPQLPKEFHKALLMQPGTENLWDAIRQYWAKPLTEFYDCDERNRLLPSGTAFFNGLQDCLQSF